LIRLDENDEIAATSKIEEQDVPEEVESNENELVIADTSTKTESNMDETESSQFDDTINNEGDDTPEA
jgi:hypothetical protein